MTAPARRTIADLDVPLDELEVALAEIHARYPITDGAHAEAAHQFLDIDPDLIGRWPAPEGSTS